VHTIDGVFKLLDDWRRLPNYQLERRADIFFAEFLADVLSAHLCPVREVIVPEFPLRQVATNRSDKVDYIAVSEDGKSLILVELKTDPDGHREEQIRYLIRAVKSRPQRILEDLQLILDATKSRKYPQLLQALAMAGIERGETSAVPEQCLLVLIQPTQWLRPSIRNLLDGEHIQPIIIDFEQFATVVGAQSGDLASRFSASLQTWHRESRDELCREGKL